MTTLERRVRTKALERFLLGVWLFVTAMILFPRHDSYDIHFHSYNMTLIPTEGP